jgi:hypothetical protein
VGLVGGGSGLLGHLQPLGQLLGLPLRILGPLLRLGGRGGGAGGLPLEVLGGGGQVLGAPAGRQDGLLLALGQRPGALQGRTGLLGRPPGSLQRPHRGLAGLGPPPGHPGGPWRGERGRLGFGLGSRDVGGVKAEPDRVV